MDTSRTSLAISVRRHHIDAFFGRIAETIRPEHRVIDIGGKKTGKRGLFDIGAHANAVSYVNTDPATEPDYLADAGAIPVPDGSYDIAVLAEILEHVYDPSAILREAHRVLRPTGKLYLTAPFLYPVHGDPDDFGRYTASYWNRSLRDAGFTVESVESQGTLFAVAASLVQQFFSVPGAQGLPRLVKGLARRLLREPALRLLMAWDRQAEHESYRSWTTGFAVVARK